MKSRHKALLSATLIVGSNLLAGVYLSIQTARQNDLFTVATHARLQQEAARKLDVAVESCRASSLALAAGIPDAPTAIADGCAKLPGLFVELRDLSDRADRLEDDDLRGHEYAENALIMLLERPLLRTSEKLVRARQLGPEAARAVVRETLESNEHRELSRLLDQLAIVERDEARSASERASELSHELARYARLGPIISALLVLGVYLLLIPRLTRGLSRLDEAARAVAVGNFDVDVEIRGKDELATVAATFTSMKEALRASESRQRENERTLRDLAREAGKAEIAAGVLHNVGNALNGVTVSAGMIRESVQQSKAGRLRDAVSHLEQRDSELGATLSSDARGRKLLDYLAGLAERWGHETDAIKSSARDLEGSVNHIRNVVQKQQAHAKAAGVIERTNVRRLVEETLELVSGAMKRHGVDVRHDTTDDRPILVDRHRVIQILANLLTNAKDALSASDRTERTIVIQSQLTAGERLRISVSDNGVGIAPDVLGHVFQYGFTTKRDGHGFGLHMSALGASEVGGSLTAASDGPGHGATFVLELPVQRADAAETASSSFARSLGPKALNGAVTATA